MIIVLGSQSEIKTQAAEAGCRASGLQAEIRVHAAASGVPNQPNGTEQIALGARTRAREAQRSAPSVYGLGIESGIAKHGERWIDIAAVCLVVPGGRECLVWSEALEFPTKDVEAALACGPDTTVGEIIAARTGCAPDDPHAFLTTQKHPRAEYLADAVEKLLRIVFNTAPRKDVP